MAGRVLRRAAALGLAAAAAGSLHALATWEPLEPLLSFGPSERGHLLESAQGLHAALLRSHPLSGVLLRDVRCRAERDLASFDADGGKGDPAVAVDLRLLLAYLAARDGRVDEALRLYTEAARDSPFDPRPCALAYYICHLSDRKDEAARWNAAYLRLLPHANFQVYGPEIEALVHELVIASMLGGVFKATHPKDRGFVLDLDKASVAVESGLLLVALQDKVLSTAENLQLLAFRLWMHAKVRALLKEAEEEARKREEEDDAPTP